MCVIINIQYRETLIQSFEKKEQTLNTMCTNLGYDIGMVID